MCLSYVCTADTDCFSCNCFSCFITLSTTFTSDSKRDTCLVFSAWCVDISTGMWWRSVVGRMISCWWWTSPSCAEEIQWSRGHRDSYLKCHEERCVTGTRVDLTKERTFVKEKCVHLYATSIFVCHLSTIWPKSTFVKGLGLIFKTQFILDGSNVYSWVNQRLDRRWPTEG